MPTLEQDNELIYSVMESRRSDGRVDMVTALRSCNAFADVREDRSLDGLLKTRVGSKMFTLYNMANSDYYVRGGASGKSDASRNLLPAGKCDSERNLIFADMVSLHDLWQIYSDAFMQLVDSFAVSDIQNGGTLWNLKHQLVVHCLEIVGSRIEVVASSNPQLVGVRGIVFDELENVVKLVTESNKCKVLPKSVCTLKVFVRSRPEGIFLFGPDISGIGRSGSVYRAPAAKLVRRKQHPLAYT